MALALARKYRPSSFSDLVGQDTVSQTLSLALDGDRLSHAYLFSGLRGSGKTSTARIFSKALLCEKGPTSQPCDKCPNCIMANENRHMDIIEMDAASNRGIDDIKELIEHTKYKPGSGRFKIFIIDEVHMLTTQAFNALLKTLEEPPDFVKFILATTDPLKLPATILSRTQHFRFKKIPQRIVMNHLQHILNLENIQYDKDALEIIARSGAGSLRDSLTLLDQAIVYSDGTVDIGTVTNMLGIIEPSILHRLFENILEKNISEILNFISAASEYETEMVIDEMIRHLKDMFLKKDNYLKPLIYDRFFRILSESKELLSIAADGEFVLSLTLFKMIEALSIKEIDETIKTLEKELSDISIAPKTKIPSSVDKKKNRESSPKPGHIDSQNQQQDEVKHNDENLSIKFRLLTEKLYDRNYDLGKIFEQNIKPIEYKDSKLKWESCASNDDKKFLMDNWGLIRTFVQSVFGIDTTILNTKCSKDDNGKETKTAESLNDERDIPENTTTYGTMETAQNMNSDSEEPDNIIENDPSAILNEPMVKEAIELFSPKTVRVKQKS